MKNSKFSRGFRNSTVQLILNNNESVVKVAGDLDIKVSLVNDALNMAIQHRNPPYGQLLYLQ